MDIQQIINRYGTEHSGGIYSEKTDEIYANADAVRLREACEKFEGLLTGMILKEGLRNHLNDEEDGKNMQSMLDLSIEHAAEQMARNSSLGIADQLMEQFNH